MIKGKTASGFAFSISDDARDDMELLENLTKLAKGDFDDLSETIVMLLGEQQKKKLYEHCRQKSGRVSATRVFAEIESILTSAAQKDAEIKN